MVRSSAVTGPRILSASLRASLLLAMSDFLDPGRGPDQSGDFEVSPSLFIALFGVGFLIGAVGHLVRSRALVAAGGPPAPAGRAPRPRAPNRPAERPPSPP